MFAKIGLTLLFAAVVYGANWAISTFGLIQVWPHPILMAPAGVLFAGAAFSLRDALHEAGGRWWVFAAIALGGAVSYTTSSAFATASVVAFSVSELADFVVYSPLRKRNRIVGVLLSNTVGAAVDSAVFLWLAFGSLAFFWGQMVGKSLVTAASVVALLLIVAGGKRYRYRLAGML